MHSFGWKLTVQLTGAGYTLSNVSKKHRRQFNEKRLKETESSKRSDELDMSKIELVIRILYRGITRFFSVDYVLCDSWFTCQSLVRTACSL